MPSSRMMERSMPGRATGWCGVDRTSPACGWSDPACVPAAVDRAFEGCGLCHREYDRAGHRRIVNAPDAVRLDHITRALLHNLGAADVSRDQYRYAPSCHMLLLLPRGLQAVTRSASDPPTLSTIEERTITVSMHQYGGSLALL